MPNHSEGNGTAATWNLPAWMQASGDANAPEADRAVAYNDLVNRIVERQLFEAESTVLTDNNPWLRRSLGTFTNNRYFVNQGPEKRLKIIDSAAFAFELMIAWLLRLYNRHYFVFPIVILSLWMLRSHMPRPCWTPLQKLGLLYSQEWTETLALDVGERVCNRARYPAWASKKVVMGAGDNLMIKFQTNFEGLRQEGEGNYAYLFINWFVLLLAASSIPEDYDPRSGR